MKNRLKELRKALNLKQREVAERLNVGVSLIGQWECGITPIPDVRIYQLCNEYNVNEDWFRFGKGEMFKPAPTKEDTYIAIFSALYDNLPNEYKEIFLNIAVDKLGLSSDFAEKAKAQIKNSITTNN